MVERTGNIERRAWEYINARGRQMLDPLGGGYDGLVFSTDAHSAIKVFRYEKLYRRERDVYLRLSELNFVEVCGCRIPRLIDFDDVTEIVEMEIVQPPYVLDFAGAYLDDPPDYPEDVCQAWWEEKAEQFGGDWDLVQTIMATLAGREIYLSDVKPGNITLR